MMLKIRMDNSSILIQNIVFMQLKCSNSNWRGSQGKNTSTEPNSNSIRVAGVKQIECHLRGMEKQKKKTLLLL